jgi:hypothetical protein
VLNLLFPLSSHAELTQLATIPELLLVGFSNFFRCSTTTALDVPLHLPWKMQLEIFESLSLSFLSQCSRNELPSFLFNAGAQQCLSVSDSGSDIMMATCSFGGGPQRVILRRNGLFSFGEKCLSVDHIRATGD